MDANLVMMDVDTQIVLSLYVDPYTWYDEVCYHVGRFGRVKPEPGSKNGFPVRRFPATAVVENT